MLNSQALTRSASRATYAPGTDSWNALADEMHNLYLLSLLLTADPHKAQQCFLGGIGECESEIDVFMSWAQARARRTIVERAIWVVSPTPEHAYDFSIDHLKLSAAKMKSSDCCPFNRNGMNC